MSTFPTFMQQRAYVLNKLDFEKIRKVMSALNWSWADQPGVTPSVDNLRSTADTCISGVHEEMAANPTRTYYSVGTGGFVAYGW